MIRHLLSLILYVVSLVGAVAMPADTLYFRDRTKRTVAIREVYPDKVRYQDAGDNNAKLISVPVQEVAYIAYNNGSRDVFNDFLKLRPEITWLTANNTVTEQNILTVKACILNEATTVRLEVNGQPFLDRGLKTVEQRCAQGKLFERTVTLNQGENLLEIVAENERGETRSASLKVIYTRPERRLALVVGNADYKTAPQLANPVNDATAMSKALREVGFDVLTFTNLSKQGMEKAIETFGSKLSDEGYQVGLFYYAGHGVQHNNKNYLVPVDANPKIPLDIELQCSIVDRVMGYMDYAKAKVKIVVLDACRNDPFTSIRSLHRGPSEAGLAGIKNAPEGTFIAYATAPEKTAQDGSGANGVFTEAILKEIQTPNIPISSVFQRVRTQVARKTGNMQIPWDLNSIIGDEFYFLKR